MIKISTYLIQPFLLYAQPCPFLPRHESEWLRITINRLYNTNKGRLRKAGIRTELFHNHDETTSQTKTLYPLIIYHYVDSGFYITGINDGREALRELIESIDHPVEIDQDFMLKFKLIREEELEILNTASMHRYRLTDWLPLNSENYKRYQSLSLVEKIQFLELMLRKNIVHDFGKFLEADLSETHVSIISADNLKRSSLPYKGHDYQPFTIEFEANAMLPGFITLGIGKAFGFGRVDRIEGK